MSTTGISRVSGIGLERAADLEAVERAASSRRAGRDPAGRARTLSSAAAPSATARSRSRRASAARSRGVGWPRCRRRRGPGRCGCTARKREGSTLRGMDELEGRITALVSADVRAKYVRELSYSRVDKSPCVSRILLRGDGHSPPVPGPCRATPQAQQFFQRLLENAPRRGVSLSRQAAPRLRYINSACLALPGTARQEFYADPDLALNCVHPDDRAAGLGSLSRRSGETAAGDPAAVGASGRQDRLGDHRRVPILDRRGRLVAIEGVGRDITTSLDIQNRLRSPRASCGGWRPACVRRAKPSGRIFRGNCTTSSASS